MIVRESISFERGTTPADSMRIGRKGRFKGMSSEEVAEGILDTVQNDIQIDSLLRQGEYAIRKYEMEDWDDYFDMVETGKDSIKALEDILIKLEDRIDEILTEGHYPITKGKKGNIHGQIFSALTQGGARGSIVYSMSAFIDEGYLNESISFEKGKDPRETMGIGDEAYRVLQKMKTIATSLGISEIPVEDLNKEKALASWRMPGIKGTDQERKDTGIGRIILFKGMEDELKVYVKGIRGTDIDQWYSWNSPRKWIENIKMINESIGFERGGSEKVKRKRLLGDAPGKIMKQNLSKTFSVYMLDNNGEYIEIGFFMRSPGAHKYGGGLKTFYFNANLDDTEEEEFLVPLSKWERNKVKKFLPQISKTFNINAYFGDKVNESVSFERGKDPKEIMKIGPKELLKSDILGRQTGWTLREKQRPSELLGLDPDDVYILGFAGEVDYDKWHFNEYTEMLYNTCNEGNIIKKKKYGDNTYTLCDTNYGMIVKAQLEPEGLYFYGGLDEALNIGIGDIPQGERESIA